jgi:hypothetical protein
MFSIEQENLIEEPVAKGSNLAYVVALSPLFILMLMIF